MEDNFNDKSSLQNMYTTLLTSTKLSDTVFIVQGRKFYAIRSIFAAASPVFENMLFGSMLESRIQTEEKFGGADENSEDPLTDDDLIKSHRQVEINDTNPKTFEFFQQYIYHLNPKISNKIVADLLCFCNKYLIAELEEKCIEYIKSADIDLMVFFISKLIKQYRLVDIARRIVHETRMLRSSHKVQRVFDSHNFVHLPTECVIRLLDNEKLKVKEEDIWEKCVLWSKYISEDDEARLDDVKTDHDDSGHAHAGDYWKVKLKLLVPYIRFPLMNATYFTNNIVKSNEFDNGHVLTNDQIISTYCYFHDPKKHRKSLIFRSDTRIRSESDDHHYKFQWDVCSTEAVFKTIERRKIHTNQAGNRNSDCLVFSSKSGWRSGVHKWSIRCHFSDVVNPFRNGHRFAIGVITNNSTIGRNGHDDWMHAASYGNTYYCSYVGCYSSHGGQTLLFSNITKNLIYEVEVTLDCDRWKVAFQINGDRTQRHETQIEKNCRYYPALCHSGDPAVYSLAFSK